MVIGCSSSPSTLSDESTFDENHAQDMAVREETSQLVWEISPTLDLLTPENEADFETMEVEYFDGVQWFLAQPQDRDKAPWIVVVHERWGLNEEIKDMTRVLAMNGYRALAVDLYDGVVAEDMETARSSMMNLDQERATANLLAAEEYLRGSSSQVASLGWCLGGKQSLELSIASDTLDATIIYYGRLTDDQERLASVNSPLLWIFAENDGGIPPSDVQAFEQALEQVWVTDKDITIYPWVDHAFANPTWDNYAQEETIDAWNKTLQFLEKQLSS